MEEPLYNITESEAAFLNDYFWRERNYKKMSTKRKISRARSYDMNSITPCFNGNGNMYRKAIRKVSLQMYAELPVEQKHSVHNILEHVEQSHDKKVCSYGQNKTRNFVLTGFKPIKV